jgi:hypothetical protein
MVEPRAANCQERTGITTYHRVAETFVSDQLMIEPIEADVIAGAS